jgi:tRNA G37 N-methylase Trm5
MNVKLAAKPVETPVNIAKLMVEMAGVKKNDSVLEPSAGFGKIALVAASVGAKVTCVELNQHCFDTLKSYKYFHKLYHKDFLKFDTEERFDAVLMCPPRNAIPHIEHAHKFVKKGKSLIALVRKDSDGMSKYMHNFFELPLETFMMNGDYVRSGFVILKGL